MVRILSVLRCWERYSNFPKAYIEREKAKLKPSWYYRSNPLAVGRPERLRRYPFRYKYEPYLSEHAPWTREARDENWAALDRIKHHIRPIAPEEWWVYPGDRVEILTGKDSGKKGTVIRCVKPRNWVYVKYLNCKRVIEGKMPGFPGMLVAREQPLIIYKDVKLLDPSDNLPCDIEWRHTEQGERVRVSKRSGRIIPMSGLIEATRDYKYIQSYEEQEKDTRGDELKKITFKPRTCTFEEDVLEEHGIVETGSRHKTYWY